MWRVRVGVQVSGREFHTHIHLDHFRVEILSCIHQPKKKEKKKDIYYTIYLTRAKIFGRLRVCLDTAYCLKIEKLINENIVAK